MLHKSLVAALAATLLLAGAVTAEDISKETVKQRKGAFDKVVAEGYKLFHSPLGDNGVACDMCHPNGADTHAETYPKFQVQIGKVVALRDMINWCIKNPVKGKELAADDPKMIALEAYITFERRGLKLEPGKN